MTSSPAKKRKLDAGVKSPPSRGLDYFFSKQSRLADSDTVRVASTDTPTQTSRSSANDTPLPSPGTSTITDEELARKLQAEWDQEVGARSEPSTTLASGPQDQPLPDSSGTTKKLEDRESGLQALPPQNTLLLQAIGSGQDEVAWAIPLDQNPLSFDPSLYAHDLRARWQSDGGSASYALLARCFVLVNDTQSRIRIVDTLVNCLRILIECDPASLLPAVWLTTNGIGPSYESLELGLGGSAISKALKRVCGLSPKALKAIYDKHGDAGDVAFEARKKQNFKLRRPKPLTIKGVYESLIKIARCQGQGSVEAKQRIVDRLLEDAQGGEESRYVVRTLCQHLRIGAVKTTMLIALSRAFLLTRPGESLYSTHSVTSLSKLKKEALAEIWNRAEEIVKACFARRPDYNYLVSLMLEVGVSDELALRCSTTLHIPLRPMLGSITRDLAEMLTKLRGRAFACEFKYDGQRAQVHCDNAGRVSIFSRHLELMTEKYPDLVDLIPRIRGNDVDSFILEGEVVAIDRQSGEVKSFQTLTNRARKEVALASITVDVCLFAFDLMLLNGQSLLDRPLRERRELLRSLFVEAPDRFTWVRSLDATSEDSEAVIEFFKAATDSKCEGIMVKILDNVGDVFSSNADGVENPNDTLIKQEKLLLDATDAVPHDKLPMSAPTESETKSKQRRKALLATYEPDKRVESWLKVKKDYSASYDTLDLIPIGAWHGQGRKVRWWSPMLLAVRNPATGSLEAVCKCISGFTDAFYRSNRQFYDDGSDTRTDPTHESASPADTDSEREPDAEADAAAGSRTRRNTRARRPGFVEYSGPEPDVWFEPCEVWEVAFADVTLSPTYTAALGLVSDARGLSLRFPRFIRKREDKALEDASTAEFLAALWRKQEERAPAAEPATVEGDEDDEAEDFEL